MDFDKYNLLATRSWMPTRGDKEWKLSYLFFGINGEIGELTDKYKKVFRNKDGNMDIYDLDGIVHELGDVLWYLNQLCNEFGVSLKDVAELNIEKLEDRMNRGVIKSEGDNR